MPIYEYHCEKCDHDFEELLPTTTSPAPPCPKCGGGVERVFSAIKVGGAKEKMSSKAMKIESQRSEEKHQAYKQSQREKGY
jgi:putative FmdB family regulatory protein